MSANGIVVIVRHRPCFRWNWLWLVLLLSGFGFNAGLAKAETVTEPTQYALNPDTSLVEGCFPPCLCPLVLGNPVKGAFLLIPTGFDGLYNTYAVTNVSWVFSIDRTNLLVTGNGTYKVGGEFALQQELSLDLHLNGSIARHFDSGLVPATASFPNIKASISLNGAVCFDKVFNVSASPVPVPQVHAALSGDNAIVLSWPVSVAPFALQQSSDLTTGGWSNVTNTPTIVGQQNQVIITRAPGNRFYRLQPSGG